MKKAVLLMVMFGTLAACGYTSPVGVMNRAIDRTVDRAAGKVGDRIGEAIAADILARNPHLLNAYAMGVFNVMFYQGGYYIGGGEYGVGEWSAWSSTGTAEADRYEKALLARYENGNEWWRVETKSTSNDTEHVVLMEALFSPADETSGARRVLRMRAMLPGDTEPREIPVTEKQSGTWNLSQTNELTAESLAALTVGEEEVVTPAGTFTATHLQHKSTDTSVHDWWVNDAVPGKMVKSRASDPSNDKVVYEVTLLDFGTDQTTSKLGIDLTATSPTPSAEAPSSAPEDGEQAPEQVE